MIVLDASILAKWFLKEGDSDAALDFKEQLTKEKIDIAIPDLALYETLNALRFKKDMPEQIIKDVLFSLLNSGLQIIMPTETLLKEAIHISFAADLSIYDSVYLALANDLGVPLVTADRRIIQQAEPFAKIELLGSK